MNCQVSELILKRQTVSIFIGCVTKIIQTPIKENIKAQRHCPLCGEFTMASEFPAQMASNAENIYMFSSFQK